MTPSVGDPLFCQLVNKYRAAGFTHVPVETVDERKVLERLDFELECAHCDTTATAIITMTCCDKDDEMPVCDVHRAAVVARVITYDKGRVKARHRPCGALCTSKTVRIEALT